MAEERAQRRLAAILAADVVGFSRLMEKDEAGTLAALKARWAQVLEPLVARYRGRVFKVVGDGVLVEFGSAIDAVECAAELQRGMADADDGQKEDHRIVLRIGINLGDVIVEGSDLYGDGVNIAARLEGLAEPGGILISGAVFDHVRGKVGIGFDDLGARSLKNIAEPVRTYRAKEGPAPAAPAPAAETDKPSIAVLPFANMSGDPGQEYFSDGITEDIITELARFRSVTVIARHSSFAFKGKSVPAPQIARELGVAYLLEGSVRRAGSRVRITAQLVDGRSGAHIWADRLDRDIDDLFAMQDEVTERIVATIANRLERTEQDRAAHKRSDGMGAYDCVLRARAILSETAEANRQSRALYERALAIEPGSVPALIGLAWTHIIDWTSRWSDPADDVLERAHGLARRALALDSTDHRVHLLLCDIHSNRQQFAQALTALEQAMALNPNDANGAAQMGSMLIATGRFPEALDWYHRAVRLNPLHPAWYLYGIGEAHYGARQYEEAIAPLRTAIGRFPSFVTPRRHLAATYAQLGRLDEARAEIEAIRKLDPAVCLALYRRRAGYERTEDLEHYLDGLRKAGLPE